MNNEKYNYFKKKLKNIEIYSEIIVIKNIYLILYQIQNKI